ncbi:Aste57867_23621 [Aphanomyces stellatus]|uniref:Aste57867_23621 protein n=1 Tax=Aphanomyces stellatus TaxID=120398 RepID=A0A485LQ15_9STRA|nr:hypothetical protein As57867_023549 [Aphanomyces stellatus]VFU00266.1 Aste57867_23621 [Aphanomyces stellatus]
MALPPILTSEEAVALITRTLEQSRGDFDVFLDMMELLTQAKLFRTRPEKPILSYNNQFDGMVADSTAIHKYRFTISQIELLSHKLRLPAWIPTPWSDKVEVVEALAITCRRLAEPCRLYSVANEVGRSVEACSRIIRATVEAIVKRWRSTITTNTRLLVLRSEMYAQAVQKKCGLSGVRSCIAFIDGTKQYISRPRPRKGGGEHENLQRSVYNGHPRRHCLNWQGITTPDGVIVSMFGPVEGRRHDSTMLSMSRVLDVMQADPVLCKFCLYGDPAYGCRQCLCCPFPCAAPGSPEAAFNSAMSSVREAVEWSFHLVKDLWAYLGYHKKMQVRKSPIGLFWLVATLLTNCHTCLKPHGNQISMYFDMAPPSLEQYLGEL